jgi:streptogramin lyase
MKHIFCLFFLVPVMFLYGKGKTGPHTTLNNINRVEITSLVGPQVSVVSPQTGPYGTIVTIKGSGFSNQTASNIVQINGMSAIVQSASDTVLTIVVPKGAGTGKISVSVNGNVVAGPVFTYIYTTTVTTFPKLLNKSISGFTSTSLSGTGPIFPALKHIAFDKNGNTYITDGNRIKVIGPGGAVTYLAGSDEAGFADNLSGSNARFNNPMGMVVDDGGNVFVADFGNYRIRKVTPTGETSTHSICYYSPPNGAPHWYPPSGLTIDNTGMVYISTSGADADSAFGYYFLLIKLSQPLNFLSSRGAYPFTIDSRISNITADVKGNIYVTNKVEHCIYKISPTGETKTIAGKCGAPGFQDGFASRFSKPEGITVDSKGNLYVADAGNNRIRKITPDGMVTTLAGTGAAGYVDGAGTLSQFSGPKGIVVTPSGILVTDPGNQRVRLIVSE